MEQRNIQIQDSRLFVLSLSQHHFTFTEILLGLVSFLKHAVQVPNIVQNRDFDLILALRDPFILSSCIDLIQCLDDGLLQHFIP